VRQSTASSPGSGLVADRGRGVPGGVEPIDGRDPDAGLPDRDLFYFDPSDLSWEAEDALVRGAADLFSDLPSPVQLRNQARVHLWFEPLWGHHAAFHLLPGRDHPFRVNHVLLRRHARARRG
jgi:hypothetical protein